MTAIVKQVQLDRIAADLWTLVRTPSPTGNERAAALVLARMLAGAGASVEIDETIKNSPSIIARLRGNRPGATFQLAGHLDHIDVPHAPPLRTPSKISGRGSADMKNGLAAIVEVVRVLKETGCNFPGEVLVTAYGLHEAPKGDSAGLRNLIRHGIKGDAALVAETGHAAEGKVVVMAKGQAIWDIVVRHRAAPCHELTFRGDSFALLDTCSRLVAALRDYNRKLRQEKSPLNLLSPESMFIGQMHYGDFYNRVADRCELQGTRRWLPNHTFKKVSRDVNQLLSKVRCPKDIAIKCNWNLVGEAYRIGRDEPVVKAQQAAYKALTGKAAPYAGLSIVTDAHRLVPMARAPTVLCGFDNEFAHADTEYVRLDRMLKPTQIMLLTVLNYLNSSIA